MSKTITKFKNAANAAVTVSFEEFSLDADDAGDVTMVSASATSTNDVIGEGSSRAAKFILRSGSSKVAFTVYSTTSVMTMENGMMVTTVTYSFTAGEGSAQTIPTVTGTSGDNAALTFSLDDTSWVISTIDID